MKNKKHITFERIQAYADRAVELAFEGCSCDLNDEDDVDYYAELHALQESERKFFEKSFSASRPKQ